MRLDLNVPIEGEKVRDGFRIDKSLETLKILTEKGAKVVMIAHIENAETNSLKAIFEYIKEKNDN